MVERFRPGCYAIMHCDNEVILVEKMQGQMLGLYDLPGGGANHGEEQTETMVRETREEIWLIISPDVLKLFEIFNHMLTYEKDWIPFSVHMIGMVYSLPLDPDTFLSVLKGEIMGTEIDGDAGKRIALNLSDIESIGLTPICKKALIEFSRRNK